MKNFIYIGKENNQETVQDESGTKFLVIGEVPKEWVVGEEVNVEIIYRKYFCGIKGERESEYQYFDKEFADRYYPNDYESVAKPIRTYHIPEVGKMIEPSPSDKQETQVEMWNEVISIIQGRKWTQLSDVFFITRKP